MVATYLEEIWRENSFRGSGNENNENEVLELVAVTAVVVIAVAMVLETENIGTVVAVRVCVWV